MISDEEEAKVRKELGIETMEEAQKKKGKPLGATGAFPKGKLTEHDEGELRFAVGHTNDKRKVIIDFAKPVKWIAMYPAEAFALSKILRKHAKKCRM